MGLLGSRCLVVFNKSVYSPVYGNCEWLPNYSDVFHISNCVIGCPNPPDEKHQGCGFHAHYRVVETINFMYQIKGISDFIAVIEAFGKIVLHEKGFRAEKVKVSYIVDFIPSEIFFLPSVIGFPDRNKNIFAANYFNVPIISIDEAENRLLESKEKYTGEKYTGMM